VWLIVVCLHHETARTSAHFSFLPTAHSLHSDSSPLVTMLRCSRYIALTGMKHRSNILFWGGCRDHHPSSQAERPPPLPASSTSVLVLEDYRSRCPIHRGNGMVCCALWLGGGWFVCNTAAAMMDGHSRSIANGIKKAKFPTCRAGAILPWAW
jgi:hypothetical protein